MGAAAWNRGSRKIAAEIERELAGRRTREHRAQLYRALLERGCILEFRANDGAVVTAGPMQTAVPGTARPFSGFRYGGRFAGEHDGSAWGTALWITQQVGRSPPARVSCPRSR